MERQQQHSEQDLWEGLFGELSSAVMILSPLQEILYFNPAAQAVLEAAFRFTRGDNFAAFLKHEVELASLLEEVARTGRTLKAHELELETKKGKALFKIEIAPLAIKGLEHALLLIFEELSVMQALREEARVLDRLAMMGTLSSGLAHEIRNPLGAIRAAAEMLKRESQSEANQEYIPIIISEVDRVNQLVTQLLDFAKPKSIQKRTLNINQLLSELLLLQKLEIEKKNITLKQEFDPSLPPVEGDEASLKQAFLNLLKNAVEAMKNGGVLKVGTGMNYEHRLVEEGRVSPMVQISISDTGTGISEEDLKSLFTPFFTTKPQGTGLGLMMTQRILKEHEGFLRISTRVGEGSQFKVLLRLARES